MNSYIESKFLNQLSPIEMESYLFAKEHLNDTFELTISNAFIEWYKTWYEKTVIRIQAWVRGCICRRTQNG